MGLRDQAELDLKTTLEGEWSVSITVTDPDGKVATLKGQSGDIGALIDPDTGIPIAGRTAHVALRRSSLAAAGLGIPQVIASPESMPWRFRFDGFAGESNEFIVRHSFPDRTLKIITCIVEHWKP